jgi:hypothetical protein
VHDGISSAFHLSDRQHCSAAGPITGLIDPPLPYSIVTHNSLYGGRPDQRSGDDFGVWRVCLRRGGRRNCSPYRRTIAAAGFKANADAAALIDKGALGGNSADDSAAATADPEWSVRGADRRIYAWGSSSLGLGG